MRIPIIINNRDLLTYPREMLAAIKMFDYVGDIFIVDNGSTYEPLLAWYETKPCEVIRTDNNGFMSPWITGLPNRLGSEFYIVTDPDLDLSITPTDCIPFIIEKLSKYESFAKIGLSLNNWNVSSDSPYHEFLKGWAARTWDINSVNDGLLLNQPIDTVFAVHHSKRYNPANHYGNGSCATYLPYSANHIPWEFTYEMNQNMEVENYEYFHYLKNSNSSSTYKTLVWEPISESRPIRLPN
jgi:hypothetical protein